MEALDPRLTGEGRCGPDRKLDLKGEIAVIGDYRSGMKVARILANHGISNWLLNQTLKRHDVARTRKNKKTPVSAGA